MKKIPMLLLLLALVAIPASATLDMQSPSDMNDITCYAGNPAKPAICLWTNTTAGGNNFIDISNNTLYYFSGARVGGVYSTYTAATIISRSTGDTTPYGYFGVTLFDSSGNAMWSTSAGSPGSSAFPYRVEVKVIGGTAYVYQNGILKATSGALAQNPTYAVIGKAWDGGDFRVDDFVYGDTESKYIVSLPQPNAYYLKQDMITPAGNGLFFMNGTLVNSNSMTSTFSRSNISGEALQNESIFLVNDATGTVYQTRYTGAASTGTVTWSISDFIASGAPYGNYHAKINSTLSNEMIAYIANGASISFDKTTYNQGDTATMTYVIDGAYWDTSTYTYYLKLYEGTYWTEKYSTGLTASSGSATYTFTSDDLQGEYYAVIEAHPNSGGNAIWMNYDYAALSTYFTLYGYVMSAQNATVLSGANVSITQNGLVSNQITIADGNYTTDGTGFLSGIALTINVTKSGYHQYLASFTPQTSGTKYVNISLNATSPTYTGLAIGGIVRTGIFDGTTITKGYGQPIGSATCHARNATDGLTCSNTSGLAGWYLFDEGNGCILTTAHLYDIWCDRTGYSNSPNYTAVAA